MRRCGRATVCSETRPLGLTTRRRVAREVGQDLADLECEVGIGEIMRLQLGERAEPYDVQVPEDGYQGEYVRDVAAAHDATPAQMGAFLMGLKLGVETAIGVPPGDTPAKWIDDRGAPIAARLADL